MKLRRYIIAVLAFVLVAWAICTTYLDKVHGDQNAALRTPMTVDQVAARVPSMGFGLTHANFITYMLAVIPGSIVVGAVAGVGAYRLSARLPYRRRS